MTLPGRRRLLRQLAAAALCPLAAAQGVRAHAAPLRRSTALPTLLPTLLPEPLAERLNASGLPPERFALHAAPVEGGPARLSWQAGLSLPLASTAKLITAAAAQDLLGADFRWVTEAHLGGPLIEGRLLGDLILVGGGDASLSSADLFLWMRRWRQAGLHEILGDILIDRRRFRLDEQDHDGTPTPAVERPHHVRPDAFTLDAGALRVELQAGAAGEPHIEVSPPQGATLRLVRAVARSGCGATLDFRPRPDVDELHVRGGWSRDCEPQSLQIAPLNPAELSRRAVGELWRQTGARLLGRVRDLDPARAPALGSPWSQHASAALPQLLRGMNKTSHNLMARQLMLSLAAGFPARPATLQAAQARVRQWLDAQALPAGPLTLDNGSGLSRTERGSPAALVALLQRRARSPGARDFIASLPVAGVDGTLEQRLRGGAAQGQAWLKTGTLLDTRALAGYVRSRSGRLHAVALLAHDPESAALATPALDACVEWLARQA